MRPNVSKETADDLEKIVDELSVVDANRIGFEEQLKVLFANLRSVDDVDLRRATAVGEEDLDRKYR